MFEYQVGIYDISVAFFVYLVLLSIAYVRKNQRVEKRPHYKNYMTAFHAKIFGGLVFASVYAIYYNGGGDSIAYWLGAERLKNLFFENPAQYVNELFGNQSWENYFNNFNEKTGYPPDWLYKSPRHFFVCRMASIACIFIPGSFYGVTLLFSFISFLGTWRLYEVFIRNFPTIQKSFRWSVLYVPSTLFWCSGIMKDTMVFTCVCYVIYFTDRQFNSQARGSSILFYLRVILCYYLIFCVKPYVVIAMFPGWMLWINYQWLKNIQSRVLKYYLLPLVVIGTTVTSFQAYMSRASGEFAADTIIEKAMIARNDFATNNTYGDNRFEIEEVEGNASGLIQAIPASLIAGLLRPFIWEARSPVVFLSGLENFIIIILLLYALFKLKFVGLFKLITSHPLLLYSILFSLILAFFVGFTTIIFGALVRFRTPMLPFFISFLLISVNHIRVIQDLKRERKKIQFERS